MIKLNFRYSEVLKVVFPLKTDFFPVCVIYRAKERKKFYDNKFNNALRLIYDFPQEFEGKLIIGKYSMVINEIKDVEIDLKIHYDFIHQAFEFQTKSFISQSILGDWIINPKKVLNYMDEDDDLNNLIEEYIQDIETDRIIKEKLEESLEKSEFLKEITSNLLITLLGLSLLASSPGFQWIVVGVLIVINIYYIYGKMKKSRKKEKA